jgi:ABC-type transport system involved in multi-copper enzyme maturation permease subunit
MGTIIRYTLITALRDWLFIGLFVIISAAIAISMFLASTALVEQQQMAIAYAAGTSRVIVIGGLIIFVSFHVRRLFENREIEVILSRPMSRGKFVVAYWVGFVVLGIIMAFPLIIALEVLTKPNEIGLLYWGSSLILEIALIMAFALVSALILRSAVTSVLSSFGFYALARMMGFFTATIHVPTALIKSADFSRIMQFVLEAVSVVLPRLDLFGETNWLVYGLNQAENIWVYAVQSAIYIPLLLALAVFDFQRKQF